MVWAELGLRQGAKQKNGRITGSRYGLWPAACDAREIPGGSDHKLFSQTAFGGATRDGVGGAKKWPAEPHRVSRQRGKRLWQAASLGRGGTVGSVLIRRQFRAQRTPL